MAAYDDPRGVWGVRSPPRIRKEAAAPAIRSPSRIPPEEPKAVIASPLQEPALGSSEQPATLMSLVSLVATAVCLISFARH